MSGSLYATLPDTSETSFAREMTDLQSEVKPKDVLADRPVSELMQKTNKGN